MSAPAGSSRFAIASLAALLLALLYMILRDMGLYPAIFGDEWTYSSFARLTPYKDTLIPSYLYYSLYGLTSRCGDSFLDCARILNALLFVAAAPFIYTVARRLASRNVAAAVALLSIAGPVNSYSAWFMPEAMYFLAFWIFSAAVFAFVDNASRAWLAASAILLGLMAMIKVHALFLAPAYGCFLLYLAWARRAEPGAAHWMRRGLGWIALAMTLALAVRLAGGYLFAGRHGLGLLGQMYSAVAGANTGLAARIPQALDNLRGHLMALALLAGMPLAALAVVRRSADRTATALMVYTVLMLGALVAVTVLFTASVAGVGAESNARLHMRYYNFLLPLLLMFAAAQVARPVPAASRSARLLAALPLAALIVYASLALLPAFQPNYIDSPELYGMSVDPDLFKLLAGVALLALAVWVIEARRGAQLFLFVFTPLLAVSGGHQVNQVLANFRTPDHYVKAGIFAHHYLRPDELKRLVVVGDDAAMLLKTRFFIDDTSVRQLIVPHGQPVASQALPASPYWLLVLGDYQTPPDMVSHVKRRNFALLQSAPDPGTAHTVRFAVPEADPDRVRLTGLSGFEPWGRWSDGKTVQVEFATPLPRAMTLLLDAAAFGPNAQQDVVVRIGAQEQRVRLPPEHHTVRLAFQTDGATRRISIEVPQPVSPSALGQSADTRTLGVALYAMAVEDNAAAPH